MDNPTSTTAPEECNKYYYNLFNLHEMHQNQVKMILEHYTEHVKDFPCSVHYIVVTCDSKKHGQNLQALSVSPQTLNDLGGFEVIKRKCHGYHYLIYPKEPYYMDDGFK
jgi:hypothetical protein